MEELDQPTDPRTISIGLSLSGGGYRAAVFHLGTLAYLHRIQLLPQLRRLSTVSGGSFTGAKYILSLVEGKAFVEFFREFYQFLSEARLIQAGLTELSQGTVRVPSGQRKLITALANVYADTFLKGKNGKAYTFGQILDADIPVKEVIFNTTEFRTGNAFRFQKSASPKAKIGNGDVNITKEDAKKIRVADIVAASSCFPGGFEPLAFPDDFVWAEDKQVPASVRKSIQKKQSGSHPENVLNKSSGDNLTSHDAIALMDGGIYDNQGISSLVLADTREKPEELGLLIISDVDRTNNDIYRYPLPQNSSSQLTTGQLAWLIWFFFITCVLTVGSIIYELWSEIAQGTFVFHQHFFSALMPLILASSVSAALWYGWRVFSQQLLPLIPQVGFAAWPPLKLLKLNEVIYLVRLRLSSLLTMSASIFMDRIRVLNFNAVYENSHYKDKLISNRIDRLIERPLREKKVPPPDDIKEELGKDLKTIIEIAVKMPTTLWFDFDIANPWFDVEKLNKALGKVDQRSTQKSAQQESLIKALVIAGQATICFNLMQHIWRKFGPLPENYPAEYRGLWDELLQDWNTLQDKPTSLLEELLKP